ncbi:virulence-associated V antigen [Shewanella sp. SR44-3]|uniref:virulence-associated V antigen n=1 Tax=Shewanella sp. SR44-3 TaxID=2760936 RepID=UPI0015FAEBDD|nr:virulence-associated V antigen [Shewanella sp. SR44-3]MBB1268990.1 hypothetical protein [Shewanella sp. SR44-3]
MALSPISNTPADIVSRVREADQGQNLTDLIGFSKLIEDKLKSSSTWSDSNDIFAAKIGADLTPVEKLSDFQRFWGLVVNQLVDMGQDPNSLLKADGALFTKLTADLESLFTKTLNAVPVGQKIDLSDVKHLALLSVFSERLDNPVLVAYQDRLFVNQAKRDAAQEELKGLSNELKIYGVIQSQIQQRISTNIAYNPNLQLTAADFGYKNNADFIDSAEYKKLQEITGKTSNISTKDFLNAKGISSLDDYSSAKLKDDWDDKLANLGTAISDKSKLINDDVSLKTTELNQISSTYNSTVEAINRFVQKYNGVLQEILRAI